MPAWSEYKQAAKERGSLALELYAVITTPVKSPEELREVLPAHLAYQAELEQQGTLVMVGLIVYRAESLQAAKAIADADPMHKSGIREYTIQRWLVNEGSFQLDIKLSAQAVRL